MEYAKELGLKHSEIVLHLDHGDSFETLQVVHRHGFLVGDDRRFAPALRRECGADRRRSVDYAHQFDVTVEGELSACWPAWRTKFRPNTTPTPDPEEVVDFVIEDRRATALAISIGTSHGANKFKPEQCTRDANGVLVPPPLAFDVLDGVMKELPGFPIVLHGSSSVPQEEVATINKYGGALKDAIGIPEEELRKAADFGRLQDQHRFGQSSGDDRSDPQGVR